MEEPPRRIAHLDMDAFYASVDLLRYPELRGQPVVIGGRRSQQPVAEADGSRRFARLRDYVGRGVITTSTYEARALGVFSGMGTMKAAKLAPDAYLLPVDFDAYRHYSRLFKAAVTSIAPEIEDRGIDEIYIDLTQLRDDSLTLARKLKEAVRAATGLSCSIGITPNKLLSKICSDLDKPDGITILGREDIPLRIWPLSVKKINGIGPKATAKLASLGIETIGELANAEPDLLQNHFGLTYALWLLDAAQGIDENPVITYSEPKSISRETTFEKDLHPRHDKTALSVIFTELCSRVADDLKQKGYRGRTIGIKLRYDDFQTVTRDASLPMATDDPTVIRRAAGECLRRVPLDKKIRLLGVRASALSAAGDTEPVDIAAQTELPL
ncbi:MAG: DNA polymerase IV [Proteobacteria bacterium]|nr:DNA polymerase IV [Pseudomonadota bacterium]